MSCAKCEQNLILRAAAQEMLDRYYRQTIAQAKGLRRLNKLVARLRARIAAQQANEQHGDSGLTGGVPAAAATQCPKCGGTGITTGGFQLQSCDDPSHDTPARRG